MSEHDDPDTKATFEALRDSVAPTVDAERGLADLHARAGRRRPGRRTIGLLGAAAVALGLVVGGVAVLGQDGGDRQVVSHGEGVVSEDSTTTTLSPDGGCDDDQVFVYMVPTATEGEVHGVRKQLSISEVVESFEFVDREATFEEFQRLFADQPDFVSAIRPEELPESFRIDLGAELTDAKVQEWEAMPGVLRVELSDQYDCAMADSGGELPDGYEPLPVEECAAYRNLGDAHAEGGEVFEKCAVAILAVGSSDGSAGELSARSGAVRSEVLNAALQSVGQSPMVLDPSAVPEVQVHLVRAASPTFIGRSPVGGGSATDAMAIVTSWSEEQGAGGTMGQGGSSQLHVRSDSEAYRALEQLLDAG